ncbi:hypothetical protein TSTA_049950 [Talaromyces stipitatus ATCC 10500]|uniref:Uncharacterized protein n=1 Tax=Talaromyces stipitatus (strain ATCC 10500 / CBS 375.48 / QM 6759 / NRRL 1006) TaxID=441959 RepID=B8MLM4_TALSN|nr:uncharacterized protein TSTA_049950 [Talaromyces stipitatus ATCC 10500]EED15557.1 hypothetical protein TSTA_049950 [Talaromyces stipitatus ATCC 10500]
MPSDYALKRTHGQGTVIIHAADLYFLDQWKNDRAISDDAQRSAIFSKWLELGSRGRMPYVERLKEMCLNKYDITEDEKNLLARIRSASDRQGVSYTRLVRTFYGEGSEGNLAKLIFEAEYDGTVFDDAALYDAGSNDGLQSLHNILTHIPQIVEQTPEFAAWYNERKRKARDEAIEVGVDKLDYALSIFHLAAKWSHVLIYDKEANDGPGNVLLVYIDDRGCVLRYSWLDGAEDLQDADGMLCSGQDFMHAWWEGGRYGEDWEPHQLSKRWDEVDHENT